MMWIKAQRRLAVWYECPQCKRSCCRAMMTPTKRNREYVGTCIYCEVPEVIIRRRYYTIWASDFYGVAGSCKEVCEYYFPNYRTFLQALEEKRVQRAKEAAVYFEREREVQAAFEARCQREREQAALLQEVERIAYYRTHAVELLAEQVVRAVWPDDVAADISSDGEDDDEHPF